MICRSSLLPSKIKLSFFCLSIFNTLLAYLLILLSLSCSPSKRFPAETEKESEKDADQIRKTSEVEESSVPEYSVSNLRVLLNGTVPTENLTIGSSAYLINDNTKIALIKPGNLITCSPNDGTINLNIHNENFTGEKFLLTSADEKEVININGKSYRGKIQISLSGNSIDVINIINLEDYVKGVLAKEMPIGKNEENFEALKALAVCVRTYALQRVKDGKVYFDLYADTRDQVYGGADAESPISNKAVGETANLILKYNNSPALVYYHSTCGGFTESSRNVFTKEYVPYLSGISDGSDPYCKISPRFEWQENFSKELIISRLKNYSLLDDKDYTLNGIKILNRFDSGRVNEFEFKVADNNGKNNSIVIKGNEIRSILRTSDGKNILWSTMFDLSVDRNNIILRGNGFGHGVGLCQWGAIALSRLGWSYKKILEHYYPGTSAGAIND